VWAAPDRLFVAVGDVAGKGIQAAAQMASLRYAVSAYAAEDPDPGSVLTRIALVDDLAGQPRFATILVCLLDAVERCLHVSSAGHLPPVIVAPSGSRTLDLHPGPPRGLGPHRYETTTVALQEGATVLAFSDGLVERRDEAIDVGIDRLATLASPNIRLEEMLDTLLAVVQPQRDDDTVICGFRTRPRIHEAQEHG
jgi:serine phosphatase RsbU (regulator of sigma subunit)